jgi:hypothetical protein
MRNTTEVINLIEKEGSAGYGIYWALMEYLRVQDGYIGDIQALKPLKRQLKIRQTKLDKVLHGYGLFVCNGNTFYSPKLNEVMKPFEQRRAKIEAYKRNKQKENSLEISDVNSEKGDIVSFEVKGKGEGKGKGKEDTSSPISSSSTAEAAEEKVLSSSFVPTWERYIDELKDDEQWMELVAMRSGLKQQFYTLFPRIVESFKRHVRAIGNEGHIVSSGDAKHYFWFFMNPSSPTYKNLILELQKPIDKGKYKYEDRDPATGQRSYCGVPIPADAPPRPNHQAVWCDGKWVF